MKFIVIKHHKAEGLGIIEHWLNLNNHEWQIIEYGTPFPCDTELYDGLIVLGGPMHIDVSNAILNREVGLINHFISQHKPTLGICLGAQLIAFSLGAQILKSGEPEFGWMSVLTSDKLELLVPQWHEQQSTLPVGAILLASSSRCKVQMFSYQQHVLATQFHPEWNNVEIEKLKHAFGDDCPLYKVDSKLEAGLQKWWFKQLDAWFIRAIGVA
jgi:GMP synthase (glutamine-hydrolysing)